MRENYARHMFLYIFLPTLQSREKVSNVDQMGYYLLYKFLKRLIRLCIYQTLAILIF